MKKSTSTTLKESCTPSPKPESKISSPNRSTRARKTKNKYGWSETPARRSHVVRRFRNGAAEIRGLRNPLCHHQKFCGFRIDRRRRQVAHDGHRHDGLADQR